MQKLQSEPAAKAMITKANAHYKAVGRDQALKDFSIPGGEYVDGEMYLYCVNNADKKI